MSKLALVAYKEDQLCLHYLRDFLVENGYEVVPVETWAEFSAVLGKVDLALIFGVDDWFVEPIRRFMGKRPPTLYLHSAPPLAPRLSPDLRITFIDSLSTHKEIKNQIERLLV